MSSGALADQGAANTAIMEAAGPVCPACRKTNHAGVALCVFCGAACDAPPDTERPPPVTITAGALASDRPAATLPAAGSPPDGGPRSASWVEGPHAPPRPISEPPPSRLQSVPDDDEMLGLPVADPLIGVVVAERYRIVEPLGRGGMGIVYKVEHSRIGKLLAMKLLTGELSRNREVVRRFKQEALTVSKLGSPNTVQVFDFGVSEGLTYLVMELVAGEDLARVLRTTGPMAWARLCKVVIQVCTSLAEAHQQGVVHRDVKPENVMLLRASDGSDVAKVLDFGLAKLREGADLNDVTSQGAIVGTPYFMSPEQIRGEPVDPRSDIYALGALMYRALTGHYPFTGPTPMAVFTRHLTESPVPPIERAPELGIPAGVSAAVLKALAKNPAHRFQRIEELQQTLVDEVRAAGTSSVDALLDSKQIRNLTKAPDHADSRVAVAVEIATRDEVERYERKLRRMRWGTYAVLAAGLFASAGIGANLVKVYRHEQAELRRGHEMEPNNTAAEANRLPFGTTITGTLGARLDATRGDRDFYSVEVPSSGQPQAVVKMRVTALPNFATCTLLYRQGFDTPLGQYCVGRPGRDLFVSALRLDPGRYFLAVLQDLDPYGGPPPFVHENVSDSYALTFAPASPEPGEEVEPNDQIASANPVPPGVPVHGTFAWARDVDVFCAPPGAPTLRWVVRDVPRDGGTVLEATAMAGSLEVAPVRVHVGAGKVTAGDVQSPWRSAALPEGDAPRCLRLRLTNDPRAPASTVVVPTGSPEAYTVEAEVAP